MSAHIVRQHCVGISLSLVEYVETWYNTGEKDLLQRCIPMTERTSVFPHIVRQHDMGLFLFPIAETN